MKSKLFRILGVVAVVAMIATALVAPVNAMINVNLADSDTTIGIVPATIDVTFTLGATQVASATAIVITFDTGWTVAAVPTATIATSNGIGTTAIGATAITASAVGQVVTLSTLPGAISNIGAGAIVQIEFTAGITNPATVGNYGCTVKTAAETTAIASNQILTKVPTIPTVPGVASVWNSAGIQLTQTNDLVAAMNAVPAGGTIKLTAGTYSTNFSTSTGLGQSFTIQGTDASAANVILKSSAPWALTGKTVVIDLVTIDNTNALTINDTTAGGAATVSNSNIKNGALVMTNASTASSTLSKDTFTVKTGAVGLTVTGTNVNAVAVTTCVFNVTGTGLGINANFAVTVSGSTFTGAAVTDSSTPSTGFGIAANAGTSTIGTSTFTGLTNALTVNAGTVSFNGNTVTTCGLASPATAAIVVAGATAVTIYNNTITGGPSWIISVANTFAPIVNVSQNTFTGNAKAATSADTTAVTGIVNMARNWWGAAANVPANVALSAGVTAGIQYTPALGAATSAGTFTTAATLTAATTIGVNVTASTGATMLGATALSANPVAVAIPSAYTAIKYWDVFGTVTSATVDFYGTTAAPVTAANTALLWYNTVNGTWTNTNATANAFANYMEITLAPAVISLPRSSPVPRLSWSLSRPYWELLVPQPIRPTAQPPYRSMPLT